MKNTLIFSLVMLLSASLFVACGGDNDDPTPDPVAEGYDYTKILTDYVDKTVVPTYALMKDNAMKLLAAVQKFEKSGTQADLNAACELWTATRAPWEQSEAFLFGPAAFKNLDPLLDSWPLDKGQLDQVLANTGQELTADYVRDGLGAVLRGFHTVEYLLFREGKARVATEVTAREKEYLSAVTEVLQDDCILLWALWNGVDASSKEGKILAAIEVEVGTPYADEFKNAGKAGSRYLTQKQAADEIFQGMMDIADEVGNAKIADPYKSKDVLDVESWYSFNSLTDFQNNIKSIQNAYLGGREGSRGTGITVFIKEKNAALDTEIQKNITAAIAAIAAIPEPFRNHLSDDAVVKAAMAATNTLNSSLEKAQAIVKK